MKIAILAALLLSVLGCVKQPVSTASSTNPEVPVALLFEHQGCKVYRFLDSGRYMYYVRCGDAAEPIDVHAESCGKSCVRQVQRSLPVVEAKKP